MLSKRKRHLLDLRRLTLESIELETYLLAHSNLPGKRGNLELAFTFADFIEEQYSINPKLALTVCQTLITENPGVKCTSGSEEFLPFCGVLGIGRIGKIDTSKELIALGYVKSAAQDKRWRIREGAAMVIQDIFDVRPEATMALLQSWIQNDSYLLHRAIVAGIAEPRFMKNPEYARIALELHKAILTNVANEANRRDPGYLVLVKGLSYTLSVVIVGIEQEGFAYLEDLLTAHHPIINKIVRENLKKKRLVRLNAENVAKLQQKLVSTV